MTLNQKMCEVGAANLAEFLCMDLSSGGTGGDIFITDGVFIEEEPMVALIEHSDDVEIVDEPSVSISLEEDDIMIEIIEYSEDVVDVS